MKKNKTKAVDLFEIRQAEAAQAVEDNRAFKASVRAKLRRERQALEAQDAAPEPPIGAALAEVKAKLEAADKVSPTQVTSALARDQLAALQALLESDREALALKSRQERAVQVAENARDTFQIVREEARERALAAYRQISLQLAADLKAAFRPVQDARREMKASGVSDYTVNSVGVTTYLLRVDIEDVIGRALDAARRMTP